MSPTGLDRHGHSHCERRCWSPEVRRSKVRSDEFSEKSIVNLGVSENSGTPQIIHLNRVFHFKPYILGYPYFWKHIFVHDSKKDSLRNHISNLIGFHQHESKIHSTHPLQSTLFCWLLLNLGWEILTFLTYWHTSRIWKNPLNQYVPYNQPNVNKNASLIVKNVQPPKRKWNKSERWTSCNIVRSCRCLQSPKVHRFGLASKVLDEKP